MGDPNAVPTGESWGCPYGVTPGLYPIGGPGAAPTGGLGTVPMGGPWDCPHRRSWGCPYGVTPGLPPQGVSGLSLGGDPGAVPMGVPSQPRSCPRSPPSPATPSEPSTVRWGPASTAWPSHRPEQQDQEGRTDGRTDRRTRGPFYPFLLYFPPFPLPSPPQKQGVGRTPIKAVGNRRGGVCERDGGGEALGRVAKTLKFGKFWKFGVGGQ